MAQSGVPSWSATAALNGSVDPTVSFQEGQAPSSLNDSARALMAGMANYRDDTSGRGNSTGGSSTAYTLSSHQGFFNIVSMTGMEISVIIDNDLLYGTRNIARFLEIPVDKCQRLIAEVNLPVFQMPGATTRCARKSTLNALWGRFEQAPVAASRAA
jgi:hypothetical protein